MLLSQQEKVGDKVAYFFFFFLVDTCLFVFYSFQLDNY